MVQLVDSAKKTRKQKKGLMRNKDYINSPKHGYMVEKQLVR